VLRRRFSRSQQATHSPCTCFSTHAAHQSLSLHIRRKTNSSERAFPDELHLVTIWSRSKELSKLLCTESVSPCVYDDPRSSLLLIVIAWSSVFLVLEGREREYFSFILKLRSSSHTARARQCRRTTRRVSGLALPYAQNQFSRTKQLIFSLPTEYELQPGDTHRYYPYGDVYLHFPI
jgi:hypothetical protein